MASSLMYTCIVPSCANIAPSKLSLKEFIGDIGNLHVQRYTVNRTNVASLSKCQSDTTTEMEVNRRTAVVGLSAAIVAVTAGKMEASIAALPPTDQDEFKLCTAECEEGLDDIPTVTTASGLSYKDIIVGSGPSPPVGFQVAADYVAMVPNGRVFDSSLEKKMPYIFRVGAGQVVAGLDEGILTMKVGGFRRLYIPGSLAFPKGLNSAPGRPRVLPSTPVVFDVKLVYIPGLELDDEE